MENKKETVEQIIKRLWEAGEKQSNIAKTLNDAGYITSFKKPWTQGSVSYIALNQLQLKPRQVKSTGNTRGSYKGHVVSESISGEAFVPEIIEEEINTKLALIDKAVFNESGKIVADSLLIAEIFDKRHDNVLRDIENILIELDKKDLLNFEEIFFTDSQNRQQRKYLLTKKGFSLLAFGFKGKKALKFKIDFIDRFEYMEEFIKNQSTQNFTSFDLMKMMITEMENNSQKINKIESEVKNISNDLLKIRSNLKLLPSPPETKKKKQIYHEGQLNIFLHPSTSTSLTDELIQTYSKENNYDAQAVYVVFYKMFESLENIDLFKLPKSVIKIEYLKEQGLLSKFFNLVHKHIIEFKGQYIKNRMLVKA